MPDSTGVPGVTQGTQSARRGHAKEMFDGDNADQRHRVRTGFLGDEPVRKSRWCTTEIALITLLPVFFYSNVRATPEGVSILIRPQLGNRCNFDSMKKRAELSDDIGLDFVMRFCSNSN